MYMSLDYSAWAALQLVLPQAGNRNDAAEARTGRQSSSAYPSSYKSAYSLVESTTVKPPRFSPSAPR